MMPPPGFQKRPLLLRLDLGPLAPHLIFAHVPQALGELGLLVQEAPLPLPQLPNPLVPLK